MGNQWVEFKVRIQSNVYVFVSLSLTPLPFLSHSFTIRDCNSGLVKIRGSEVGLNFEGLVLIWCMLLGTELYVSTFLAHYMYKLREKKGDKYLIVSQTHQLTHFCFG